MQPARCNASKSFGSVKPAQSSGKEELVCLSYHSCSSICLLVTTPVLQSEVNQSIFFWEELQMFSNFSKSGVSNHPNVYYKTL